MSSKQSSDGFLSALGSQQQWLVDWSYKWCKMRDMLTCDRPVSCSIATKGPPVSLVTVHLSVLCKALKMRRVLSKAIVATNPCSGRYLIADIVLSCTRLHVQQAGLLRCSACVL